MPRLHMKRLSKRVCKYKYRSFFRLLYSLVYRHTQQFNTPLFSLPAFLFQTSSLSSQAYSNHVYSYHNHAYSKHSLWLYSNPPPLLQMNKTITTRTVPILPFHLLKGHLIQLRRRWIANILLKFFSTWTTDKFYLNLEYIMDLPLMVYPTTTLPQMVYQTQQKWSSTRTIYCGFV